MLIHISVIALQCAALAAFLILWYFWVRRKLGPVYFLNESEEVLFPFRHFSWILMGLLVVTCVAQIHFVRVSSTVHERMAALASCYGKQDQQARDIEELKNSLDKMRKELSHQFKDLRVQIPQQLAKMKSIEIMGAAASQGADHQETPPLGLEPPRTHHSKNAFAREAKASSRNQTDKTQAKSTTRPAANPEAKPVQGMRLNRQGLVTTDNLSVKKEPRANSPGIETVQAGDNVKVTEKRFEKEQMWFRVITPSGRAGWVEFHHVRLGGNV
jgi:hypothetical protein